ncbi:hypothetical protein VIGAN_01514700, partial [Vigna angularis var. angularis]
KVSHVLPKLYIFKSNTNFRSHSFGSRFQWQARLNPDHNNLKPLQTPRTPTPTTPIPNPTPTVTIRVTLPKCCVMKHL